MKNLSFLVILILCFHISHSQSLVFDWAKSADGPVSVGLSITTDAQGNVYTLGSFVHTVDFDPGPGVFNLTSTGLTSAQDIFIQKLDSSGNFKWAVSFSGDYEDMGYSIKVDGNSNVYTTGFFEGTVDFDPGISTYFLTSLPSSSDDVFISKLDSNGHFIWAKQLGGTGHDRGYSLQLDNQNNVYTTGSFQAIGDFDPGSAIFNLVGNPSSFLTYVSKLDSNGNFIWAKSTQGNSFYSFSIGHDLRIDNANNIYIVGDFVDTIDFDPGINQNNIVSNIYPLGPGSTPSKDGYILKLDSAGNFIWAKQLGGSWEDELGRLTIDSNNNLYLAGKFSDTVDFDLGSGVFNMIASWANQLFVQKMDSAGNFFWAKQLSGIEYQGIEVNEFKQVLLLGKFNGSQDFDPGPSSFVLSASGIQVFLCGLDSNGNFSWAGSTNGTNNTNPGGLAIDLENNVLATGYFSGTEDFDPNSGVYNLNAGPNADMFNLKLSSCSPKSAIIQMNACDSYTWLGQTYTSSGSYVHPFTSSQGCDSTITLDLSIYHATSSTFNQYSCNSFMLGGQTYTANGTYTQTITNSHGCDSNVTFNLTLGIGSIDSMNQIACDSYSLNGVTYASSGIFSQYYTNTYGCDSIITINLTLNHSTSHSINQFSCSDFTLNGQTYTASGSYVQMFTNANGCDSTLHINLTLTPIVATVTQIGNVLTANMSGTTYQWIDCLIGLPIAGETNQQFIATSNGSYAVVINQNGCTDTSTCIVVTDLGIHNPNYNSWITISPNPSTTSLQLSSYEFLSNVSIQILALNGKTIIEQNNLFGQYFSIDISHLSQGIYFVEIGNQSNIQRMKFVKE